MKQHTARQPGARSKGRMPDSPRAHRRKPASPPSSPPRRKAQKAVHAYFWTKEEDRLLAKARKSWQRTSGRELARRLGRSVVAVENRRRHKFGRVQPPPRPWKRSEERYLGIRMDPEVARLIDRHPAVVAEHRRQLGVPAVRRRRPWTRVEDRLLGTMPDPAVGKRMEGSLGKGGVGVVVVPAQDGTPTVGERAVDRRAASSSRSDPELDTARP